MIRMRLAAVSVVAGVAVGLLAGSCGPVREARHRVFGPADTATITGTATSTPTATPTPPPPLPPNPDGLTRWNVLPVHFCISAGGEGYVTNEQFFDAVRQAFDAWGVAWRIDGACGPVTPDDRVNEIGWGSLAGIGGASRRSYEAGLTQTVTQRCTANCDPNDPVHLSEADITIDSDPPREFRSERCFYSTLLHEAGHFLGVGHLPLPAVMAAETASCPAELTEADRAELRVRYGARAP
jgi:hypothetical protein